MIEEKKKNAVKRNVTFSVDNAEPNKKNIPQNYAEEQPVLIRSARHEG